MLACSLLGGALPWKLDLLWLRRSSCGGRFVTPTGAPHTDYISPETPHNEDKTRFKEVHLHLSETELLRVAKVMRCLSCIPFPIFRGQ